MLREDLPGAPRNLQGMTMGQTEHYGAGPAKAQGSSYKLSSQITSAKRDKTTIQSAPVWL